VMLQILWRMQLQYFRSQLISIGIGKSVSYSRPPSLVVWPLVWAVLKSSAKTHPNPCIKNMQ
jgi:hypothetical protein